MKLQPCIHVSFMFLRLSWITGNGSWVHTHNSSQCHNAAWLRLLSLMWLLISIVSPTFNQNPCRFPTTLPLSHNQIKRIRCLTSSHRPSIWPDIVLMMIFFTQACIQISDSLFRGVVPYVHVSCLRCDTQTLLCAHWIKLVLTSRQWLQCLKTVEGKDIVCLSGQLSWNMATMRAVKAWTDPN